MRSFIVLFSKENYCSPSPCYNGQCTVDTTIPTGYICQCDKGWGGNHCDKCTGVNCGQSILVLFYLIIYFLIKFDYYLFFSCFS